MKSKLFSLVIITFAIVSSIQDYQSIVEIDKAFARLGFMGDEDTEIAVDNNLSIIGLFRI